VERGCSVGKEVGVIEINRIYAENCLDTMARMPDGFVDLTVTSPPYNLGVLGSKLKIKKTSYYADDMSHNEYQAWLVTVIQELLRVTKYHVFFNLQQTANNRGIVPYIQWLFQDHLKETFVWAKTNPPARGLDGHETICSNGFEYVFCFSNDKPETNKFTYANFNQKNGDYIRTSIISSVSQGYPGHNCVFPEHIPLFFIKNFSKEDALIYDPFMGSGTTAKAAHQLKRRWIGSEISSEYVELANKRLEPYLMQEQLF
jgi:site-specific DNA-methyltransferase (adenine-specific)/modification methylase